MRPACEFVDVLEWMALPVEDEYAEPKLSLTPVNRTARPLARALTKDVSSA